MGERERNPRIDPQAGDILRKGSVRRFVVYREINGMVGKTQCADKVQCCDERDRSWPPRDTPPRNVRPTLKQFRQWAKYAHVERQERAS